MVACGLRFILQSCHLLTTYDASHSSDFKLLCINQLNFPVIKQQLLMIVISPGSGGWLGSAGLFWLQRVAGWWWLGGQAADRVESTCKLLHSHAGAWARRIQTAVGWVHGSLSLSPSLQHGCLRWADFSDVAQGFKAVCPERACRACHVYHILVICGKLWEGSAHPQEGGLVSTSWREEWQSLETCLKTVMEQL